MSFLDEFPYSADEIIEKLKSLSSIKVLVIGDTIIDQYYYSSSIGKSPKDNIIVAKYLGEETFAGGVLATANHIAGFCEDVTLLTCLGRVDTRESFIRKHLKPNIKPVFFYREDTATIVKERFVEPRSMTKVFGVSKMDDYPLPKNTSDEICSFLKGINEYDIVLVMDFGHGMINEDIINILSNARFLAVNAQTNTDNAGYNLITRYPTADYICMDEPEARLATQSKYEKLESLAEQFGCPKVAITHGQYDTLMYNGEFHKIPVFSNEVRDTTGAGDAFFSVTAPCVQSGFPMDLVGFVGNCVGALKVREICNRSPIAPDELYKFIRSLLNGRVRKSRDISTG